MTTNPYHSPQESGEPTERKTGLWKRRLIELLVVIGVIAMLVALLLPARRGAREAARRTQCGNNLSQIALALMNYESAHGSLPPAYTVDAEGKPLHSWRTLILPFMELHSLYAKIDLTKPWDDPANREAFETPLHVYQCPSAASPAMHTTYLAIVGPRSCFRSTEPRRLSEITDDHDLTLMVIEGNAEQAVHWMSPTDVTEEQIVKLASATLQPHPGGAQAVSVSGRGLFVSADGKAAKLRALVSIDGNDDAIAGAAN